MDGICKSKAGSVLVSCVHDLPLDLSESLIFFSRQTLYKEQEIISCYCYIATIFFPTARALIGYFEVT